MVRQSSEVRALAREISALKQAQRDGSLTPQLGRSSLDDESINTYDSDGNLRARYGLQHDGTYTAAVLDGPVPPVPTVPTVEGGAGELTVTWDGTYEDDQRAPMDFHVVEVWAADDDFSDRSEARLLGHFSNESGGDITVARPVGEWHVALVSKAQSGRRSAVSERAIAEVTSVVDQETIDELNDRLEDLPSVTWSPDAPTTADGDGKPDDAVWRQVDAETDAITGEWTWDESAGEWVARPIADDAIYSLDVGKLFASELGVDTLVAEEIWASKIAASKIDAEEINTQTLGADEGFIGVLNSAEIVGAVIKTAETGTRVELDSGNGIRIYNHDNELVLSADSDGNLVTGADQDTSVRVKPTGIDLVTLKPTQLAEWPTANRVFSVAVSGGLVYVASYSHRLVEVYGASSGVKQREWSTTWYAQSVAVSGGLVYVATNARTIEVYSTSGVKRREWNTTGDAESVAVSGGLVYVATYNDRTIEVYSPSGVKQREWNTTGTARSVAVFGGLVYVATEGDRTIEVYSTSGVKQTEWNTTGYAQSVAVFGGLVYVATYNDRTIEVYSTSGVKQTEWNTTNYGSAVAVYGNRLYVGTYVGKTVETYSLPGTEYTTTSLDAETGRLDALSADLGGVTRAETLTPNTISPRGRDDNEDYPPTVEIVRPAFTRGLHVFEDETHRDLELPDPPDGTTAWTGQGSSLTLWLMTGGQWIKLDHTPPYEVASGVVTMNGTGTKTVTFPAGVFSGAPTVVVSAASSNRAPEMDVHGYNFSDTSFTILYQRASKWNDEHGGDRDVAWIAWRAK